jgi:beta-glucuronidase
MKHDIDIIKSMGCNLMRTSHYPKDETFLDLCDEMGVMVWAEATGWQNTPEMMTTPLFAKQCAQCIDEMIEAQFNHPSIIIWGLLNEVRSEFEEVRPVMSRLISRIRELDPTRPLTFATNRLLHNKDRMLDLVDIISPNLYTGWYKDFYGKEAENLDESGYFEKLLEWFDEDGLSGKPVLIGEFGAGGIAGFHSFAKERWSEEFQSEILQDALETYTRHPRCAGAIAWLFSDTLCCESEGIYRPYSHNCKGIVDAYRRPKAAYGIIKKYFTEADQ